MSIKTKDHLGNEYKSVRQMCAAYNIAYYTDRIKYGWSIKDALTAPIDRTQAVKRPCVDHKGVKYDSVNAMVTAYGLTLSIYYQRLDRGWDLGKILTTPVQKQECADHLGNKYFTIKEMCDIYGINIHTYVERKRAGWSIEECLTRKVKRIEDHLGNEYESYKEMADAYNISVYTLKGRIYSGRPIEKALTTPAGSANICIDHLGNEYASIKDMCEHYGIDPTNYYNRKKNGMDLKTTLTTPLKYKGCCDHLGNYYKSEKEMARAYGLKYSTLVGRIHRGMDIRIALTMPVKRVKSTLKEDILGKTNYMKCGLSATVTKYKNVHNMQITFEDGILVKCEFKNFEHGDVRHPNLKKNREFHGHRIVGVIKTKDYIYYETINTETGEKNILTPQDMLQRSKQ